MAECNLTKTSIDKTRGQGDTVIYEYLADLGVATINPFTALSIAQSLGPNPVPNTRSQLAGTPLFVTHIHGEHTTERKDHWRFVVTSGRLPPGEDSTQQNENPLLRPPVYGIRYLEQEYVVKKARNRQALGVEFAAGAPYRAADTLGPIVNGAGRRPDEPIVRTRRSGVITIQKNYSNLGTIMDLNEEYQESTNSDSVTIGSKTFVARRLKYEVTEEGGRQEENGVVFYPSVTEISIHKTTDLTFDNVGYEYYTLTGALKRAMDEDGEPTSEPVNLSLNGRLLEDGSTQIDYGDLTEKAYATTFFS